MNAVISGASSGIGRALARTFAAQGHKVLAVARRAERLQALAEELPGAVEPLALDLTAPGSAAQVCAAAIGRFGTVHVLVNAAGMSPYQPFGELHPTHLRQILQLNVQALTELCHGLLPHMLAHGEPAHIVNVGSVGGYAPLPNFAVYSGSKHYVRLFSNCLRHECRGSNVRVSTIHPGGTLTEFPALAGQRLKPAARGAMLTPEQVAARAYPAILKGRRVIIPGTIDKAAILLGKLLPFPWAMAVMARVYGLSVERAAPTYPL